MRRQAVVVLGVFACGGDRAAKTSGSGGGEGSSGIASSEAGETSTTIDSTTDDGGSSSSSSSTGVEGPTLPTDDADDLDGYADADDWNFPSDNYFVCGRLKESSAQLRYLDFTLIGATGEYSVTDGLDSDECAAGEVRFDLHEILETGQGRLYFHKGGQGYDDPKTPYGHLWIADLESPAPKPQVSGEPPEYGAPSKIPGTDEWDWERRNGVGCDPPGDFDYAVRIVPQGDVDALPKAWQYKPNATSSRFDKYADAGAEQAEGTAHHAYLLWSWLHRGDGTTTSPGGGQVRALIVEGQRFLRCAVESIDSIAYAKGTDDEAGRVTAIYGKTRASDDSPWIYGWTIHSHRARNDDGTYAPRVYHVWCADEGC
jgi:hypothetical protein